MAEFADIFVAHNLNEAMQYRILEPNLPHISLNGFTDYEISALWASIDHSHVKPKHELIYIDIDADEVLYQLPDDFLKALANLTVDEIVSVAIVWAEYEEIHWQREVAVDKVTELQTLAKKAQLANQQLYFILI